MSLYFPACRYDAIQIGEAAEVLVLSPQSSFNSFKASFASIQGHDHTQMALFAAMHIAYMAA